MKYFILHQIVHKEYFITIKINTMKNISIFAVSAIIALTSCSHNDSDVTTKTTIKACFGEQLKSNTNKASRAHRLAKTSGINATIYKQVPCNVEGFSVSPECDEQSYIDGINNFTMAAPTDNDANTETFNLKNIHVGINTFTTKLNLCDKHTAGVFVDDFKIFNINRDAQLIDKMAQTNLEAVFEENSITSEQYNIKKTNNTKIVNLGKFKITNGGAKIRFYGDEAYNIRFIITETGGEELGKVSANINENNLLVINKLIPEQERTFSITLQVAYNGIDYEQASGSKEFTISRSACLQLSVRIDDNYNLIVKELGNVNISIDDFTVTGNY